MEPSSFVLHNEKCHVVLAPVQNIHVDIIHVQIIGTENRIIVIGITIRMAIVTLIDLRKIIIVADPGHRWEETETETETETEISTIAEKGDPDHHMEEIEIESEIVTVEIAVELQKEMLDTVLDHVLL
jgi:hypothetical protein